MYYHKQKWYFTALMVLSLSILGWIVMLQVAFADSLHNKSSHMEADLAKHEPKPIETTPALQLSNSLDLKNLIPQLAKKQVVFVGEIHTRYDHHLTQLEIIRRLHAIHPDLIIGMESFQQPFQQYLDEYISGELDEREMLRRTEYYVRWRYDYRLYAPILQYAREHAIPVIALNVPMELSRKVGRSGLESLDEDERAQLPQEIDRSDEAYTQRLKQIFNHHSGGQAEDFENFLSAQLVWDEGMAQSIADQLELNPEAHMVVLAGRGHLAYGDGIPKRVTRRTPVTSAIVLNGWEDAIVPGLADVLLLPQEQTLPKAGKIGASLEEDESKGEVRIASCLADSACAKFGLKSGDQIVMINEQKITNLADLRVMMWDREPGEEINVTVRRQRWFKSPEELSYSLTLN